MENVQHNLTDTVTGIVLLLFVAAITSMLSKKVDKLPLTVLLVLVGIMISNFGQGIGIFASLIDFKLTPELVLFVFIPTLIFESAFNLDIKKVSRNLLPILSLAVPGLLISTGIIGFIFFQFTEFGFLVALLLGAILSATDPVAVISIFKQLGVPDRLTVLVEGESLFNDATALVLATILTGLVVSGVFSTDILISGFNKFLIVFIGGIIVGLLFAFITGWLIGMVESDADIEITLTTILAYFAFIVAEHIFHVSGIMAVVASAMTMGSWGKSKISPSTANFMEHFWEYLAYVANALIFLLVGLQIDLISLWQSLDLILLVSVSMLFSRALVIFIGLPVIGKIPGSIPIGTPFKLVMYWGGLRGAIALAIVLSLPEFEYKDTLVTIVMGAVLFTLVFQGLTIEVLVKFLGLNKLNDADTITKLDGNIQARKKSKDRISDLVAGGYFSERIADNMRTRCDKDLDSLHNEIKYLSQSLSEEETLSILSLRCLARENKMIYDLFSQGLIDESAFRELNYWIGRQIDNVRYRSLLPTSNLSKSFGKVLEEIIISITQKIGFATWSEKSATSRVIRDYTISWGRFRSAQAVIKEFDIIIGEQDTSNEVINNVKNSYLNIIRESQKQINEVTLQYPEFIESVQEQLGQRLILITEYEAIGKSASLGLIKEGIASKIRKEHSESLRKLKDNDLSSSLEIEVEELIKKVPMFNDLVDEDRYLLAELLKPRTIPRGRQIIKQGEKGDSLFLIARGIAKVEVEKNEQKTKVASLYAGDFFGEAALLHSEKRNATTTAITPCSLYELMQEDLELLFKKHPKIKDKITETDQQR